MEHHYKLKRSLGFWEVTLAGIGIILGAGIYALIGKSAGLAGGGVWLSFLIASFVAAMTGLSYAELSSIFPKAGAEYVYTKKGFGNTLAFLIGWMVIFSGVIGGATVALGFGGYLESLTGTPLIPAAIGLILVLSFIIFWGIKQSARIAVIFTLIEAAGLILIIAIGVPNFGSVDIFFIPEMSGVFAAAALIFFAYIGFEQMTRLSEETKKPTKNIPKAIIVSIAVTTVIYMLVAISAISIIPPDELAKSNSPIADVAAVALGNNAFILLSIIALFSTANTVLLMMLSSSRIAFGIARDRCLPGPLARIHSVRRTPYIAIILIAILTIVAAMMGDISVIASITNFTLYVTFIVINASVIVLRFKYKKKRPFLVPGSIGKVPILPVFGLLTAFVMMFSLGMDIIIYGAVLLFVGWVFYKAISRNRACGIKDYKKPEK